MKNSTLVVFLMLAGFLTQRTDASAAPFHVDNIVLKNFQAIPVASGAKIIWEFTSEEKDVTCNLEKSIDGINFTPLRTIQVSSTRQQALHTFTDKGATGQAFYRLRVTKESFLPYISPIVSVILSRGSAIDPALGTGLAQISGLFGELSLENTVMSVKLVDLNGQAKIKQYVKGTDLERIVKPTLSRLPAGYYVLRINDMENKTLLNRCIYKF